MGSIVSAHCECGYESGEMPLGGGMINFTTQCNVPHYCGECKILFIANLFEKKVLCPECRQEKVIVYDDERACKREGNEIFSWNIENEIARKGKITDGEYICPNCEKFNLIFLIAGNWD